MALWSGVDSSFRMMLVPCASGLDSTWMPFRVWFAVPSGGLFYGSISHALESQFHEIHSSGGLVITGEGVAL